MGRSAYGFCGVRLRAWRELTRVDSGNTALHGVQQVADRLGVHPETVRRPAAD
jgi:hypothetical protein